MPTFSYSAIDPQGNRVRASQDANSQSDLERDLEGRGMALLEVNEGAAAFRLPSFSSLFQSSSAKTEEQEVTRKKVTRRDLIEFAIYMGTLAESGVSLPTSLRDFAGECNNPWFGHVVGKICRTVEQGTSLSEALANYPDVFSNEFVQLIRAGERTGTLPRAFHELRAYMEWRERLAGDIKQATTYPIVITIVLASFILYLFSFVIPKIAAILVDMKLALPWITRVVLSLSNFAVATWWVWVILAILVPFVVRYQIRHSMGFALWLDRFVLKIPVFGAMVSMIVQSRFTRNFAVLHRAGIPILENLELCTGLVGNHAFALAIRQAGIDIRDGSTLSSSLRGSKLFSALVMRMVAAGESTGSLDTSLQHAANYYDQEVPRRVKAVFGIFEPAIILFLVAVVGTVALAIFLPILSLQGGLR